MSGLVSGEWALDRDLLRFHPDRPFSFGETVTVAITLQDHDEIHWSYQVRQAPDPLHDPAKYEEYLVSGHRESGVSVAKRSYTLEDAKPVTAPYGQPSGIGGLSIYRTQDATPMNLFTSLLYSDASAGFPVMVTDSNELSFYRRRIPYWSFAEPFDNIGRFVEFDRQHSYFILYDTSYTPVDTIHALNGFITDVHHIEFLVNGNVLLLALETHVEDLSDSTWAGQEEALVVEAVVQELDPNRQLLFQWRSADEASCRLRDTVTPDILTSAFVDYMHPNSVAEDEDGNLIVSLRNQSEVIKIDRFTGELIWRLGGVNNEFEFINEVRPFSAQHDARRLNNGNLLLFDNGSYSEPEYGRAVEYDLDEEAMTATRVWSYDHNQEIVSGSRGSAQRLPNGNTLMGWGGTPPVGIIATEVDPAGNIVMELYAENPSVAPGRHMISYRVRYTSLALNAERPYLLAEKTVNNESRLLFASFGTADVSEYDVYLDSSDPPETLLQTVVGNSLILDETVIPPGGPYYAMVQAHFSSGEVSEYSPVVEFFINVLGVGESSIGFAKSWATLTNWPNPFNASTIVGFDVTRSMDVRVAVTNLLGREVAVLHDGLITQGHHSWTFDGREFSSGLYFVHSCSVAGQTITKRIVLLR